MGTDYYLIDPIAKEVKYIDRSGSGFCCVLHSPERQDVKEWPYGPVRVVSPECLAALKVDLDEDDWEDKRTMVAWQWCQGRSVVLLVDDTCLEDEESYSFCHDVAYHQSAEGWNRER